MSNQTEVKVIEIGNIASANEIEASIKNLFSSGWELSHMTTRFMVFLKKEQNGTRIKRMANLEK